METCVQHAECNIRKYDLIAFKVSRINVQSSFQKLEISNVVCAAYYKIYSYRFSQEPEK